MLSLQKEEFESGKAPKGSIDLLLIPPEEPDSAAFVSGSSGSEIHLVIRGRAADKDKHVKASKDRAFVLQAPDSETAQAWLAIVKEWVLYLHHH